MDKRFDVVIVDSHTRKVCAVVGTDLTEAQANRRVESALRQTNIGPYFVAEVPAGTLAKDAQFPDE